ncbi:MAG TPA: GPW/gp25 family protein [Pyrinomonadaceae bacterium]|nr:GPW/gp25 family protein [Pyrinomonadaceae bacterium]
MSKPFLGVGWPFPLADASGQPRLNDDGSFKLCEYEESVRESIWIVLGTAKGERAMRPTFGCGIYDLVFEINSAATAGRVAEEVRDALLYFEPRIDVLDVQVQPAGDGEVLLISLDYQVRATNNVFNLVYPFYLERSTA